MLLDVRNDYEWEWGRFEGAVCPPVNIPRVWEYAKELKSQIDLKHSCHDVLTGGIRCEIYSSLLIKRGSKSLSTSRRHHHYGLNQGKRHWLGKLLS